MNIFENRNYRQILRLWIEEQPKHGRGILRSWSLELRVHSTLLSQILSGKKELSLEHAEKITQLMHFTETEQEYFLLLLLEARAGTANLKKHFQKKINELVEKSRKISERLKDTKEIPESQKAQFYSSWLYSGIRNLTALEQMNSSQEIAQRLGHPRELIQEVVDFLLSSGLCILKEGKLSYGPARTHLSPSSPYLTNYHQNWRSQAAQKALLKRDSDLFFTFPMSLSHEDALKLRALLPDIIEKINKIVGPSPSETVRCLNIDFFEY
jgi:uncharacterized protein (TIGR02147 family)